MGCYSSSLNRLTQALSQAFVQAHLLTQLPPAFTFLQTHICLVPRAFLNPQHLCVITCLPPCGGDSCRLPSSVLS